ncbi:MAG: site-2 protease family protein [Deltaproteobacteria bacterium]|nr:site-2 protease family protein [Deltaproteobacteria bacterium]
MNLSPEQLRWVFVYVITLIMSVALHEWGHAFMADKLGDDTPRRQGRVTLNPVVHADPIGTLALPLISALLSAGTGRMGGFGWGRPVQWNPARINRKWRMYTAIILVSIAGPMMNFLLGTLLVLTNVILNTQGVLETTSPMQQVIFFAASINFTLFFFNLVPVPPLDGGHVAEALTPYKHRKKWEEYLRFSPFVFLALICIPQVQQIFVIPAMWCMTNLYSLFFSLCS